MTQEFRKGDTVEWDSHGGTARGSVLRKITADTEAAGRTVRACLLYTSPSPRDS